MRICKENVSEIQEGISEQELELINRLTKRPLGPEEVFVFSVLLCDNEVDRDFERFTTQSLEALGELFLDKTGIFDHEWKAGGQKARIYKTEVLYEPGKTTIAGDVYAYLKAGAYMLRTEANLELIQEIEGGIKREVSVGCAVSDVVCSICGNSLESGKCAHERGMEYDGRLCYAELLEPTDAYEWSFVAVPAQRSAGVMKKYSAGAGALSAFVQKNGSDAMRRELSMLRRQAELGNKYMSDLKEEVKRLGLLAERDMDREIFAGLVEKMDERELNHLRDVLEKSVSSRFPLKTQLNTDVNISRGQETEYLI